MLQKLTDHETDMLEATKHILALALLPLTAFLMFCGQAMGHIITVDENSIVSLANAPAVLRVESVVDEADRPSLLLVLSFANECLSETGVNVKLAQTGSGAVYAIIMQRINESGCPDIFNPVEKRVRVLLPSSLAGGTIRLVAKPLADISLREIALSGDSRNVGWSDLVVEASSFSGGDGLPVFDLERILRPESGRGYRLAGKITVNPECVPQQVTVTVYEVPDENGEPLRDVVLISAPRTCLEPARPTQLEIQINSPQRISGRSVLVLNTRRNAAVPITP